MSIGPEESAVDVTFNPPEAPGYAAIVRLRGEHDIATGFAIMDVLQPIDGSVIVDLSECTFLDSSVIGLFLHDHQTRSREHRRLTLVVPLENTAVRRTLGVVRIDQVVEVLEQLPEP